MSNLLGKWMLSAKRLLSDWQGTLQVLDCLLFLSLFARKNGDIVEALRRIRVSQAYMLFSNGECF